MPVRIRLQRHGKKGQPFYQIVVADGRAPRDGKFIENLGTYNPMTKPATVMLDIDKAVQWMRNGAQPSDTVRTLLSHKGAMLKHHLLKGVDKGALTAEQAEAKFQAWISEKEGKVSASVVADKNAARDAHKQRMDAEAKVNAAKAEEVAKKKALAEKATQVVEEAPVEEAPAEEASDVEAPAVEEAPAAEETPAAE